MNKFITTALVILLACFAFTLPAYAAVTSTTPVLTIQAGKATRAPASEIVNAVAADSGGTASGSVAGEAGGVAHQTTLTITAADYTLIDDGTTGHAATALYTFPQGYTQVLGASTNIACTSAGTMGATPTVVFALGSTATADSTLTTTDANMIASTSSGAFVASAGSLLGGPVAAPIQIDGHTTAVVGYLNIGIATDPAADSILTCTGTVTISWVDHGDN